MFGVSVIHPVSVLVMCVFPLSSEEKSSNVIRSVVQIDVGDRHFALLRCIASSFRIRITNFRISTFASARATAYRLRSL